MNTSISPRLALTSGLQVFSELERWLSDAEAGGLGLRGLERGLEPRGRELLRVLLQNHLQARGQGDVGLALASAQGQILLTHKRLQTRGLVTVFGSVSITRVGYGGPGRASILIGAIDGKGIPMVKSEPALKTVRLGKGEKRNKKRMATVAAVFSQQPQPRTPEAVVASLFDSDPVAARPRRPRVVNFNKRVWASLLAGKDAFITDVKAEMARRDPDRAHAWVIVTDGERALQRRVCAIFEGVTLILDLLHVLEKLWAAAYVFHPEGSQQAEDFVRERALRILRGQASQVVKGLRQMVTKRQLRGASAKTLLDVAGYYYRNRSRMRYDVYLANGWPIASGCVEGACKNLIKDRMERSGMRWTPAMAEAMVRLRAVHLSGDFDAYWEHFVRRDQQRLYPAELLPVAVVAK